MVEIGVVGAGVAAAGCACALERARPAAEVTVLEASGAVGGRAATSRREGCTYDYGANYLKDDDERVSALVRDVAGTDGLVDVTEPVYTFDRDGAVSEGRDADEHKWTYESGLAELPRRLFAATDATVHTETRVERLRRDDAGTAPAADSAGTWTAVDSEGTAWGPFDALVLTPPAPETAALLRDADWDAPVAGALRSALESVPYRSIYSAVCGYEFAIEQPYYALVNADRDHAVGWISREECKEGHVPAGETALVVQASPQWSREHDDAAASANATELAGLAAEVVGDERLAEPAWTDGHAWTAALPEESVASEPVAAARERGLYCAGDWVAGEGRLHAAIRSGLDAGEAIAGAL